jgi:hypothetical protein
MIKIDQPTPTDAGTYIWRHSLGIEIIEVYWIPARTEFGSSWDPYLAVRGHNRNAVHKLQGTFSKRLIVTEDGCVTDQC